MLIGSLTIGGTRLVPSEPIYNSFSTTSYDNIPGTYCEIHTSIHKGITKKLSSAYKEDRKVHVKFDLYRIDPITEEVVETQVQEGYFNVTQVVTNVRKDQLKVVLVERK